MDWKCLLVASNAHISLLSLFHPLWKITNDSKNYVPTVPMSFKVLKYFSCFNISFSCLLPCSRDFKLEKFVLFCKS